MTRELSEFVNKKAAEYCKEVGTDSQVTATAYSIGFEDALALLMNCANCRNGKTLFDEGCIGCIPVEHTKWMIREEK